MSARSLRDVYDDESTLVMPTRPTPHATSSVIPIARSRDGRRGVGVQPMAFDAPALRADAPAVIPRSRAAQTTQPSRRHTSDVKRYRRLSLALAICLAFALGVTASLATQIAAHFTPVAARTPRDGITRAESIQIFDGVETKAAPPPRPRRPVPRSPAPSPPTSAVSSAPISAPTPDAISDSTATPSPAPDASSDLSGRDLLSEGLSDD